jgi:AcrR family transcriptional regulator
LDTAASLFASHGYVRTLLKDVADACGILPGSLYHHFDSKEAIVVELIERYQAELDHVGATALERAGDADPGSAYGQMLSLSLSIARTAVRHRAALQLTLYEPHAGASERLVELTRSTPLAVQSAMEEILRRGQASGAIKPDLNIAILAEQVVIGMRSAGIRHVRGGIPLDQMATALCHLLINGIATAAPTDRQLDGSKARRAADKAIVAWQGAAEEGLDEKSAVLRSVARAEFARRGYEATTMRDIALAAGMGTGSIYRFISSKEELLASIMNSYHANLNAAYNEVIASESTAVAKLDALTWLTINVLDLFPHEFQIQLAWLREIPPDTTSLGTSVEQRFRQLRKVVSEGLRSGEMRLDNIGVPRPSQAVLALCIRDLVWLPVEIVEGEGKEAALSYWRASALRGIATKTNRPVTVGVPVTSEATSQ